MAINAKEERILLQKSGNRCAFDGCRIILTSEASPLDRPAVLGQIAHIVAERQDGPRGDFPLSLERRNSSENLILLCNRHHQLVDSQPLTYTVDRLHAMKDAHEQWVRERLSPNGAETDKAVPKVTDTVFSTLLPVTRLPRFVYGAPCSLATEREVQTRVRRSADPEVTPFILKEGMVFAFQNMNLQGNAFQELVEGRSAERFSCREWWDDPDRVRWFVQLLGRSLNKLTGHRGLMLDKDHNRYYFRPDAANQEKEVQFRPLNQKQSTRHVVWRRRRRLTGEAVGYWYHRAVSLHFMRTGDDEWCLSVRPELRVTVDGIVPPASEKIGPRVTRQKSRRFNYDLLGEVNFWRDYLSGGKPRILMSFGPEQLLIVETGLLNGTVTWPGIPAMYAKPFKNVDYLDDLFSWAEMSQVQSAVDEDLAEDVELFGSPDEE